MCRLIETIKVKNGQIYHIDYHCRRMNHARRKVWNCRRKINLSEKIEKIPSGGLWKCRVIYAEEIEDIQFIAYRFPKIKSLQVVEDNHIDYAYKYENRQALRDLYRQRGSADDILILKGGKVTDTFFCNVVFQRKGLFYTPSTPLLRGTQRQSLIDRGIIEEKEIRKADIPTFEQVYLINAMISLEEKLSVEIENILL